jgi:predicted secreted Zn-dependent protease
MAALLSPASAAGAEWKAVERIETYAIAGKTGLALYESIGERGPLIRGKVRTVAYTDFKLTWTRDYQARDGVCTLASATPKLIITYRLPKPSAKLPADTARRWATFISGLEEHEKVHGDFIKEMVAGIEAQTVGLSVENDPHCRKIRTEMTKRLSALSQAQRKKSADFDRVEMSDGGNIHQLILALIGEPVAPWP